MSEDSIFYERLNIIIERNVKILAPIISSLEPFTFHFLKKILLSPTKHIYTIYHFSMEK
jgi:hypothetical protein